jgi:hypothetical protein
MAQGALSRDRKKPFARFPRSPLLLNTGPFFAVTPLFMNHLCTPRERKVETRARRPLVEKNDRTDKKAGTLKTKINFIR